MSEVKEIISPEQAATERWEEETLAPVLQKRPERKQRFETVSLDAVERLYTPADVRDIDFERDTAFPGEFPYTRGIHPTGYRGKLWTMRQFAGFGTPEETNARFKYLMAQGQTGLSVAYDLPTLMGYDADAMLSEGEVGKCGVAVSSLADMETLFDGIPLEEVTVSQTINAPASVLLAMYLVVAEKQGADWRKISGTLQNDILKEYIAQKEWIYPIRPAMKLVVDTFEFCTLQLRFHTQTAGVSLTVQQPLNNIVRVAIQALAGVLGGTQSLHTDAYDEALALPTDQAALIALRTQQIIVGVNKYAMEEESAKVDILVINEAVRERQLERLEQAKSRRDAGAVANS